MMDLKATLWKVNEKGDGPELSDLGYPFRIQDITRLLRNIKLENVLIVEVDPYDCDNDPEKLKEKINILMESDAGDGIVVTASAYVSTKEFPESEYYCDLPGMHEENEDRTGKKELPFDETMRRQCKILEDAGLISINKYCGLEFSDVYISPLNMNGKKVCDEVDKICEK